MGWGGERVGGLGGEGWGEGGLRGESWCVVW